MSEMQQQVLQSALARAQREVQAEIQGTWCDALACLLVLEWPRARKHLLTPAPQSTSVVVQAWMQVGTPQQNACKLALNGHSEHQRNLAEAPWPTCNDSCQKVQAAELGAFCQSVGALLYVHGYIGL